MIRKIFQIGDKVLEAKASKVNPNDEKTKKLVQDLIDTCKTNADETAGISAPQIGESKRICICRRTDLEEKTSKPIKDELLWEVMINPEIVSKSNRMSSYWEGCLSVGEGDEKLFAPVKRPSTIVVKYIDKNGNYKELECKGFFSHVVQHELDHLEGILFLKYVNDPTTIWKNKDLDKYFKENNDYPSI